MEFGSMNRRKFLKLFGAALLSMFFIPLFAFAKSLPKKVLIAIKKGKYPGKVNPISEISIKKVGKWLG